VLPLLRTRPGEVCATADRAVADRAAEPGRARAARAAARVERWLGGAALTAAGLLVFLILFGIVYGVIIQQGRWLQGSIFLLLVVAAASALGLVVYNESLKERLTAGPATHDPARPAPDTSELLPEAHSEPVPSVTERTTALLASERRGEER
jgi:hypothetical protein